MELRKLASLNILNDQLLYENFKDFLLLFLAALLTFLLPYDQFLISHITNGLVCHDRTRISVRHI
jgi:hypothetical protein